MRTLLLPLLLLCRLATAGEIPYYQNPKGRLQPVIAVVGYNGGTELTDFAIPYGVLARSGAAQVLAVATQDGPMTMRPALRIQPQETIAGFDRRFPESADYVIVPAVGKPNDAALVTWITAQSARGATIVSICDGALVVANAASTGYVEEQNLRRAFQRQLGVSPGQYRSRFSGHGTARHT